MYTPAAIVKVELSFKNPLIIDDFSAKLVKTLLISGSSDIAHLFSKASHPLPKPIHITPIYTFENGKVRALYPYARCLDNSAKPSVFKAKRAVVPPRKRLVFLVSCSIDLLQSILSALSAIPEKIVFRESSIYVHDLSYRVTIIDVDQTSSCIESLIMDSTSKYSEIKLVFGSPTVFRDPFSIERRKHKLLIPSPEAIFDIPVIMTLIESGIYRKSMYLRFLRCIRAVLSPTYSALKTANLVWYKYDDRFYPSLIGYVKMILDHAALSRIELLFTRRYGTSFINLLSKAILFALVYGIGCGRAAGFGHVSEIVINGEKLNQLTGFP